VLHKLRSDDGSVEGWIGLLMLYAAAAFVEGVLYDTASNDEPEARLETDWRREVDTALRSYTHIASIFHAATSPLR
jgi:hypothetical protein